LFRLTLQRNTQTRWHRENRPPGIRCRERSKNRIGVVHMWKTLWPREFSGNVATELTVREGGVENCFVNGSAGLTVDTNGCEATIRSAGGTTDSAEATLTCPSGKKVQATYNGCVLEIPGGQTFKGGGYKTIGTSPNREVTVTGTTTVPKLEFTGTQAQCLINPNQTLIGTVTTANAIVTAETPGGVMADAWYE